MLPAASTALPDTTCPVVSAERTTGPVQSATPLDASVQAKVTVGFELFQPAALGAGDTEGVMRGGVVSGSSPMS